MKISVWQYAALLITLCQPIGCMDTQILPGLPTELFTTIITHVLQPTQQTNVHTQVCDHQNMALVNKSWRAALSSKEISLACLGALEKNLSMPRLLAAGYLVAPSNAEHLIPIIDECNDTAVIKSSLMRALELHRNDSTHAKALTILAHKIKKHLPVLQTTYQEHITQQPDGKILIPEPPWSSCMFCIDRFLHNDEPDGQFGTDGTACFSFGSTQGNERICVSALQNSGKIIAAGYFGQKHLGIVRIDPKYGALDTSFGTQGKVITHLDEYAATTRPKFIRVHPGDDFVVAGWLSTNTDALKLFITLYDPAGTLQQKYLLPITDDPSAVKLLR